MSSRDRSRRRHSPSRTVRDSPIEYTSDGHRIIRRTTVTEYTIEAHPSDRCRPSSHSRDRPSSPSPRANRRSYVSRQAESSPSRSRPSRTRSPSPWDDRRTSHNRHGESPAISSSRAQEYHARSHSRQEDSLPTRMSVKQIRDAKRLEEFMAMKRLANDENARKENLKQQIVMWENTKHQHTKATNSRTSPEIGAAQRLVRQNHQQRRSAQRAKNRAQRERLAAEQRQLQLLNEHQDFQQQQISPDMYAYPEYLFDANVSCEQSVQDCPPTFHHVIPAAPSPPSLSELLQSASQPRSPPRLSLAELAAQSLTVLGKRPPVKPSTAAALTTLPTDVEKSPENSRKRPPSDHDDESKQPNKKNTKMSETNMLVVTDVWLPTKIEVDDDMPEVTTQTKPEQRAPVTDLLKAFLDQEGKSERTLRQSSSSPTASAPLFAVPQLSLVNQRVQSADHPVESNEKRKRHKLSASTRLYEAKKQLRQITDKLRNAGRSRDHNGDETREWKLKGRQRVAQLKNQISQLESTIGQPTLTHPHVDRSISSNDRPSTSASLSTAEQGPSRIRRQFLTSQPSSTTGTDRLSRRMKTKAIDRLRNVGFKEKKAAQLQHDLSLLMKSQGEGVSSKIPPTTSTPIPTVSVLPVQLEIQRQSPAQLPSPPSSSTTTDMSTIRESIGRLLDDGLTAEELIEHMQKVGSTAKEIVTVMEVAMTRKGEREKMEKAAKKTQHLATIKNLLRESSTLLPEKN